jgi:hypothetical protein
MIKKREILGVLFEFKALLAASFPTALGRACLQQNFTSSGRLSQFVIRSSNPALGEYKHEIIWKPIRIPLNSLLSTYPKIRNAPLTP